MILLRAKSQQIYVFIYLLIRTHYNDRSTKSERNNLIPLGIIKNDLRRNTRACLSTTNKTAIYIYIRAHFYAINYYY